MNTNKVVLSISFQSRTPQCYVRQMWSRGVCHCPCWRKTEHPRENNLRLMASYNSPGSVAAVRMSRSRMWVHCNLITSKVLSFRPLTGNILDGLFHLWSIRHVLFFLSQRRLRTRRSRSVNGGLQHWPLHRLPEAPLNILHYILKTQTA